MSKKFSRRVFLKATGLAALSVAAAGALAGCGGVDPTPGSPTFTAPDDSAYQNVRISETLSCELSIGQLSTTVWTSQAAYEADHKKHNYLYTGLYIKTANNPTKVTVSIANSACSCGTLRALGNITLNSGKTGYVFPTAVDVASGATKNYPLYIDIGDKSASDLYSSPVTFTLDISGKTVEVEYSRFGDTNPTITVQ